jgi:hypothetical protein
MDLTEKACDDVDWFYMAQDRNVAGSGDLD